MTLKHDSKLVQWAYWPWTLKPYPGDQVSLCRLFWQTIWSTLLGILCAAFVIFFTVAVVTFTYEHFLVVLAVLSAIATIIGICVGIAWLNTTVSERDSAAVATLKAYKSKVCPLIRLD